MNSSGWFYLGWTGQANELTWKNYNGQTIDNGAKNRRNFPKFIDFKSLEALQKLPNNYFN